MMSWTHCTKKFPAALVTFTEEIPNGQLYFLGSDRNADSITFISQYLWIANFALSSQFCWRHPCLSKQPLKIQKMSKELKITGLDGAGMR